MPFVHVFGMHAQMAERDPEEEIKKAFALFDDDQARRVALFRSFFVFLCSLLFYQVHERHGGGGAQSGKISLKNLRRVARELGEVCAATCLFTPFCCPLLPCATCIHRIGPLV